jgi:hypothetical protein
VEEDAEEEDCVVGVTHSTGTHTAAVVVVATARDDHTAVPGLSSTTTQSTIPDSIDLIFVGL